MANAVETFMTTNAPCVDAAMPSGAALGLMTYLDVLHLPVLAGGQIVGVVSLIDLQHLAWQGPGRFLEHVADSMALAPYVVEPSTDVSQVVTEMANRRIRAAIVAVDHRVVGIFTATDALQASAAAWTPAAERRAWPRASGMIVKLAHLNGHEVKRRYGVSNEVALHERPLPRVRRVTMSGRHLRQSS